MKKSLPFLAAALSGLLLALSFAPFEYSFLAWFALVPLVIAADSCDVRRGALLGWVAGFVFFIISLFWLRFVTWAGFISIAFYSALYFMPFAVLLTLRKEGWRQMSFLRNLRWMILAAATWAGAEYLRSIVFTGFPWNPLGASQYAEASWIQIASIGGVYMLSALMVFMNMAIAITLLQYLGGLRKQRYKLHAEVMTAFFVMALTACYGFRLLLNRPWSAEPVQVALIQPNIEEVGNWELADPDLIYERLEQLTDYARRTPGLDLMIWPETAVPDCVRYSPRSSALVKKMTGFGIPLLVGSMDYTYREDGKADFYNASMLFSGDGKLLQIYRKQHLVLFGEYIPFEEKVPLINALTPIGTSFTPGTETALLNTPGDPRSFSPLICFEDSLPYLARRAARAGATWLVNQTNDSWFDPGSGSKQHLANAVFRCVETGLPMLRCANTGVTCAIDARGTVKQTLDVRTAGFQVVSVTPADPDRKPTFYVRHGDLFAQACLLLSIPVFLMAAIQRKKTNHA